MLPLSRRCDPGAAAVGVDDRSCRWQGGRGDASASSALGVSRRRRPTSVDKGRTTALCSPCPGCHGDWRILDRPGCCLGATVPTSGHHGRAVRPLSSDRACDDRRQRSQPESDVRGHGRLACGERDAPGVVDGPTPGRCLRSRYRPPADCRGGASATRQLRRRVRDVPSVGTPVAGSSIGHDHATGASLVALDSRAHILRCVAQTLTRPSGSSVRRASTGGGVG